MTATLPEGWEPWRTYSEWLDESQPVFEDSERVDTAYLDDEEWEQ